MKRKPLLLILVLSMVAVMIPSLAFADDAVSTTSWADLYKNLLGTDVSAEEGYYDAVTSATKFGSHHANDIPSIVNRVLDEEGKTTALNGVNLTGKAAAVTPKVASATWATFANAAKNKKYGTDELIIYPDDTVEGYVWNEYLKNIYAVTISDGKNTAGALPWVDYYGESATAGVHYNKIEVALNSGIVPAGELGTNAAVHRFDKFYKEGVLNPGIYTVTVYSEGYTPLVAEVKVPTYTAATLKAENADVSKTSTGMSFEGLPADYAVTVTVDGTAAEYQNGELTYAPLAVGSHTIVVSDKNEKYNDLTGTFMVTTDKAAAIYDGTKLITAEGAAEEDFAGFIRNISKVTINETPYAAAGRGAVKVIAEDGSIDLSKTAFADSAEKLNVLVNSTGYPDLTFVVGESQIVVPEEPVTPEKPVKPVVQVKKTNPMTAKGNTVKLKVKKLKKKAQTIAVKKAFTVKKAQGKVTYSKKSGNKKILISKAGKVTVKKGLKKGTYKVKVNVKAAGNKTYKAITKVVTLTVKIK